MDYSRLISKIASDKNSTKLGKIVRIEKLLGKTIKKNKPYAMILVRKRFKKDVVVPIDVEKIVKMGGQYVWFDILKEEFDAKVKTAVLIQTEREIYTGDTGFHKVKGNLGFAYEPYRLSRKGKERKR
ncbi:MAG: hypothetical protein HZR80_02695 [Candidatus Heimdallarchaeota archaeon]